MTDNQVSATSPYANGNIAIRPYFWSWGNGWQFAGYGDWVYSQVTSNPNEFTIVFLDDYTANPDEWSFGYEWWWWNGSAWVDQTFTPISRYTQFVDSLHFDLSYCIT
jgi:hypothetical protein